MLDALTRHDAEGGYSHDGAVRNDYMVIAYRKLEDEAESTRQARSTPRAVQEIVADEYPLPGIVKLLASGNGRAQYLP